MKLMPVNTLIENKKLLLIDDSIVRGTQIRRTIDFLYDCAARELHVRSACPPILYSCKYLNFTRSTSENDLISRQIINRLEGLDGAEISETEKYTDEYTKFGSEKYDVMVEEIRRTLNMTTLSYHSLDGLLGSVGIPQNRLCTYCWNGKE